MNFNKSAYDREKRMKITLFLNRENDKDIIQALDEKNKQGSIKSLIRKGLLYNEILKLK